MSINEWHSLVDSVYVLADQKRYDEALELLTHGLAHLPASEYHDNYFPIMHTKASMLSRCYQYEECLSVVGELIDQEMVCGDFLFDRMDSLGSDSRYIALQEKNRSLRQRLQVHTHPTYEVHLPEGYSEKCTYPLFITLHGDGSNAANLRKYWSPEPFTQRGFIAAYLQSSQVAWHNVYAWRYDPLIARRDILSCYKELASKHPLNMRTIIGGFSGGAITAIDAVLADVIPLQGFICLCPEIKPRSFSMETVYAAAKRGVRGVIMEGEHVLPVPDEDEMIRAFNDAALPIEYYTNPNVGHAPPADFCAKLEKALSFILRSDSNLS